MDQTANGQRGGGVIVRRASEGYPKGIAHESSVAWALVAGCLGPRTAAGGWFSRILRELYAIGGVVERHVTRAKAVVPSRHGKPEAGQDKRRPEVCGTI